MALAASACWPPFSQAFHLVQLSPAPPYPSSSPDSWRGPRMMVNQEGLGLRNKDPEFQFFDLAQVGGLDFPSAWPVSEDQDLFCLLCMQHAMLGQWPERVPMIDGASLGLLCHRGWSPRFSKGTGGHWLPSSPLAGLCRSLCGVGQEVKVLPLSAQGPRVSGVHQMGAQEGEGAMWSSCVMAS